MDIRDTFKMAVRALWSNKVRSALTILGIVIGITAIILVVSVGQGAEQLILNQIQAFGSKTISIQPGRQPEGPSDFSEIFSDSLKPSDLEALKRPENVQGIDKIAPMLFRNETVTYEGETFRGGVAGSTDLVPEILDLRPNRGVLFSDTAIDNNESVAVIGAEVKEELFGPSEAVGEKIKIGDRPFRIIGTFAPKGQVSFFDVDNMVLVPYTTAQKYIFGIDHFNEIIVQAETEEMVPRVVKEIELTLREQHGIDDPDKDDFRVVTQEDAMETVGMITGVLTALLVSIAAVSLVVGGVGIMNIMLVSVVERTREVGLRKAVGATKRDILKQFLLESVILTGIGGVIGITVGFLLSLTAAIVLGQIVATGWEFVFSIPAALLGLGVSALVGIVFGIYPAKEAAEKSPIEALRYE